MESVTQPKLYRLQSDRSYFYAGYLPDGTQVFMKDDSSRLFGVFFDVEGRNLRHEFRQFSPEAQSAVENWFSSSGGYEMVLAGREAYAQTWADLDRWASELGSTEGTISFQKFCLPDQNVCIHDLPPIYEELIDEGEVDEDTEDAIEMFRASGLYVFICFGQDFDIGPDGEVVSA